MSGYTLTVRDRATDDAWHEDFANDLHAAVGRCRDLEGEGPRFSWVLTREDGSLVSAHWLGEDAR